MYLLKPTKTQLIGQLSLLALLICSTSSSFAQFGGGQGTSDRPWLIETAEHLNEIRGEYLNDHFLQRADIDLSEFSDGEGWEPIGEDRNNPFTGSYDGVDYHITNLTINRQRNYQGLFGVTDDNAELKNIIIKNAEINGASSSGGLVGRAERTIIEECSFHGKIYAPSNAGGLVGNLRVADSRIVRSFATGEVRATNTSSRVGGLIGGLTAGDIIDCYSTMMVIGDESEIGGLIGHVFTGNIIRCYATGPVIATSDEPDFEEIGGLVGENRRPDDTINSYWNVESSWQDESAGNETGITTAQMVLQDSYEEWDFEDTWGITEGESYPFLAWEDGPAHHNTPCPYNLAADVNDEERIVTLTWDILDDYDPVSYNIYRNRVLLDTVEPPAQNYIDEDVAQMFELGYYVTALFEVDDVEMETTPSNIVTVMLTAEFPQGDGTAGNPYHVNSPGTLTMVRDHLDAHFEQVADIDLGVSPWNEGNGWLPIGHDMWHRFTGSYDGGNYVISGLTINRQEFADRYLGLFGWINGAELRNIGIIDADITGGSIAGGIVGRMDNPSIVEGCYVTGSIIGNGDIGGLVGQMFGDESGIRDSYSTASVESYSDAANRIVGGIVAQRRAGDVKRNYATGVIETAVESEYAGAIIGRCYDGEGEVSHNYWNIETTELETGGPGVGPGLTTFEFLLRDTFVGFDFEDVWDIIEEESYPFLQWQGDEPDDHNYPELLLPPTGLTFTPGYETIELTWRLPTVGVPDGYNVYRNEDRIAEMVVGTRYEDTDVTNWESYSYHVTAVYDGEESEPTRTINAIAVDFAGGTGTEDDPFLIETAENLDNIRRLYEFPSLMNFRQNANINLGVPPWNEDGGWEPIGDGDNPFGGTYDGAFYEITNLTINRLEETLIQALFGKAERAVLKNIGLRDVDINTEGYLTGGLVGRANNSEIKNCYVIGSITGSAQVGGIAGENLFGNISNCFSAGDITAVGDAAWASWIGGLVGWNLGQISDSYSTMDVVGNQDYIGGLVGSCEFGDIERSYSTGSVSATAPVDYIGGLAGELDFGEIVASYWDTQASGQEESAGGEGRETADMIYPYGDDMYVNWDFDNIWMHDDDRELNNGYPILHYQIERLDSPQISIEIDDNMAHLSWNAVEGANSYLIYAAEDLSDEQWEEIDRTDETDFAVGIDEFRTRFFHVVASPREP